jgi:hypothetical protein
VSRQVRRVWTHGRKYHGELHSICMVTESSRSRSRGLLEGNKGGERARTMRLPRSIAEGSSAVQTGDQRVTLMLLSINHISQAFNSLISTISLLLWPSLRAWHYL